MHDLSNLRLSLDRDGLHAPADPDSACSECGAPLDAAAAVPFNPARRQIPCVAPGRPAAHIFHSWCLAGAPGECPAGCSAAPRALRPVEGVPRVGIDVGGVIIGRDPDSREDTSLLGPNYLQATELPGAIDGVAALVRAFGAENAFIVSKAKEKITRRTLEWFERHDFFARTGLLRANVHFCESREAKAPICRDLGISHFIDDHVEVLRHVESVVANPVLFAPRRHATVDAARFLPQAVCAASWDDVVALLCPAAVVVGVDVGGVIIGGGSGDGSADTIFGDNFLEAPEVPGAIDGVAALVAHFGADNVVIVSKAGRRTADRTLQWMAHRQFVERTGMLEANVHFCREREDKLALCAEHGVTHFIDDHAEVLRVVEPAVGGQLLLFNPGRGELQSARDAGPARAVPVASWGSVLAALVPDQPPPPPSSDVVGVDVGGVIIAATDRSADTSFFGDNFLETPEVPGAIDGVAALVAHFGADRVVIVSKAGRRTADRTRQWMAHRQFVERTGMLEANVHFCREREDKLALCAEHGVTHFIDDHANVLRIVEPAIGGQLLLFGDNDADDAGELPARAERASTWRDVLTALGASVVRHNALQWLQDMRGSGGAVPRPSAAVVEQQSAAICAGAPYESADGLLCELPPGPLTDPVDLDQGAAAADGELFSANASCVDVALELQARGRRPLVAVTALTVSTARAESALRVRTTLPRQRAAFERGQAVTLIPFRGPVGGGFALQPPRADATVCAAQEAATAGGAAAAGFDCLVWAPEAVDPDASLARLRASGLPVYLAVGASGLGANLVRRVKKLGWAPVGRL